MAFDFGAMLGGAASQLMLSERTRDVNARSAADQRQSEEREAVKARDFSHDEALLSRDWTRDMSNTSHRREVEDLRQAGLNPILSGTGGMGASSPSGAMATSAKASAALGAPAPNYGAAVSSALEANRTKLELANLKETNEQIIADTGMKKSHAALMSAQHNVAQNQARLLHQEHETEVHNTASAAELARIHGADRRGRELEGEIDETTYGKVMRYIDRAAKSVTGGASAVDHLRQRPQQLMRLRRGGR